MKNILLKGCPGSGKTFLSRAVAFYLCHEKLEIEDVFSKDTFTDLNDIEKFINSERCEFFQVHSAMSYEDIVYGLNINATGSMAIAYAEKRIKQLCDRAAGKADLYCIILDDISRTDAAKLLGNIPYAMEYRNEPIDLPDGNTMSIPTNVVMIFTECSDLYGKRLDYALRRRMGYVRDLVPDKALLEGYYDRFISKKAKGIIAEVFETVSNFVSHNISSDAATKVSSYMPAHGMFMVEPTGTSYFVLDCLKQKFIYQVFPYLQTLHSSRIVNGDLDGLLDNIKSTINTGISGLNNIVNIKKVLLNTKTEVAPYSLPDTKDYFVHKIIPDRCKDHKGILESVIDAIVLNGVFPHDIAMSSLLTNTDIAKIPRKTGPIPFASYLVKEDCAPDFYYETPKKDGSKAPHAYYFSQAGRIRIGRWVPMNDVTSYQITYSDGSPNDTYLPLSGLRGHIFTTENVCTDNNAAEIYGSTYLLISNYLKIYEMNISLIKGCNIEYNDLDNLLLLEMKYLKAIDNDLRNHAGEKAKVEFFGKKLIFLHTLWNSVNTTIKVNKQKFNDLVNGNTPFSIVAYEDIFIYTPGTEKNIKLQGVVKMTDLKDYQKVMENIGVRQMIFQGPPGTSKTFDSKKFVLKQLDPSSAALSKAFITQEDISKELNQFKLTNADYEDPSTSGKIASGGWDLVQFHPSYGYEDFIRGIEVKTSGGMPSYNSVNRILGKIAEFAKIAEQRQTKKPPNFYLVIDEINRANLATVFGELIYGLEYRNSMISTPYEVEDKAAGKAGEITRDIVMGNNLFIIGTMNTADKSIDAIDYAIRRRFIFVDSPTDRNVVISCYQNASSNTDTNSIELFLFDAVQTMFDNDSYFNDEYQKSDVKIGHTYFLRKRAAGYEDDIVEHFVYQIIPILREYSKDGILDTIEDLVSKEHTVKEIKNGADWDNQVKLLGDNIMLFTREFGNKNKLGIIIDNKYVGDFVKDLISEYGF